MTLPLFFSTKSEVKFHHISYLCSLRNVELIRLPYGYPEIQDNNMTRLLSFSLDNMYFPEKDKVFFIIEQTSVYLESFPKKGPGFYFKDWWENTGKEELRSLVNVDPRATIESGVALSIPRHTPLIFTNRQKGKVSLKGYIIPENRKYRWLSSDDFNLYFIPSRATRVYNAIPLNEGLKYDFRKPNIDRVCDKIDEFYAILSENMSLREIESIARLFRGNAPKTQQKRLDSR